MSVIGSNALAGASGQGGSGGFVIEKSLRFNDGDSAYLNRTPSSAGTTTTWTYSCWVKRAKGSSGYPGLLSVGANSQTTGFLQISFEIDEFSVYMRHSGGTNYAYTNAKLRDNSAWYHLVVAMDTTAAAEADRLKMYVNGVQQTFRNSSIPAQNQTFLVNDTAHHQIGATKNSAGTTSLFYAGYMADVHLVDGQALGPGSFGAFDDNGVWQAIEFTGNHNFTPTVTYPAVYVTSPGAYGAVTDVNTVNGNVFTSAGSAGAGSIKVEFSSAITGVTHVKFKGGGYSANAGFSIKVNGSTTHSSLTTNSSYSVRTETLSSATDITSFEIVSASDGWALGDLQFSTDGTNFTAPSGTAAVIPDSGVNGFHLNFVDGNDIGNDSSGNNNDWTVNNLTSQGGTVDRTAELSENHASGSVALPGRAFDTTYISSKINTSTWAVTTTAWEGAYSSAYAEFRWIPAGGYAVSSSLRVYYGCYDNTAKTTTLTITYTDGSTETDSMTSGNNNWMKLFTASNAAGKTVQKIEMSPSTPSATNLQFGGFVVDGQIVPTLNTDSDVLRDSPTNGDATADTGAGGEVSGNYATWNPLTNKGVVTTSNGNLTANATNTNYGYTLSTIPVSSGKYYCEISFEGTMSHNTNYSYLGIVPTDSAAIYTGQDIFRADGALSLDSNSSVIRGTLGTGTGESSTTYQSSYGFDENDTIGIAIDCDTPQVTFYKNGTSIGTFPHTMQSNKSWVLFINDWANGADITGYILNAGQKTFKNTAPSGFKALCTANLPTPDVPAGSAYFDVKTWTGSGGLDLASTSIDTSTAYRHHRILFEGDNNGGSVSEIQFFDADGLIDASDTNNAGGSISSNKNQGLDAWTAFNGTLGGSSYSYGVRKDPSSGFYIAKDWGSGVTKTITAVKIWGVDSYAIAGNTASTYVKLQGSNDGSTWTDLQTWDDSRTGSWTSSSSTQVAHTSDTATTISGYGFNPDLVWIKKRAGTSDHALFDTIRGATKRLYPNDSSGQDTLTDTLTAFNSDGFSLGNASDVNSQGDTYVGWAWDAGTSNTSISTGGLNSSVYDQSQRWRNYITSDIGWATNYGPAKAFNGVFDADGGAATDGANGVVTFTPPAMTVTSLEVNVYANSTITLPDGTTRSITGSGTVDNWSTVDIGSGFSFTGSNSIVFTPPTGVYTYIERIKINGKELVDDDVSVTNVPSIASTVRANPSAGFSMVSWTGTGSAGTLGHGLQKKPELIITKVYSSSYSDNWPVYHPAYGAGTYTYLNDGRAAPASYTGFYNGIEPTSNVFSVGTANSDNTKDLIAYCFTSVEGYSKIDSYLGNGSTDGPFVYTGFRPAFILLKNITDASTSWTIHDNKRLGYNPDNDLLFPDTSGAENSTSYLDILSNGFKLRISSSFANSSGKTFIYAAFAENPFQANGGLAR